MNISFKAFFSSAILVLLCSAVFASGQNNEDISTESNKFDTGKMWTFDYPPLEYLRETYGFDPSEEWFDDVRLSALRIPGCTASFVSENGLMMTNNHCSDWHRDKVEREGENLSDSGFYAAELDDERRVPGMYAEQLVFILDVTDEVYKAIDSAVTDEEKIEQKEKVTKRLVEKYNKETDLNCQLVSLFNGGKYSIYGYRRFEDVRLVFVPEESIGYFGGDFDNFTYPRYNLDCAFFRVYDEDGKPVNSNNYYKFSNEEIQNDQVIFSVGNPGRTRRLHTVSQLEYYRDLTYRNSSFRLDEIYNLLEENKSLYPDRAEKFEKFKMRIGNSQKVYHYMQAGLLDPYLIARKRDFENKLIDIVKSDPDLQEKYEHIWDSISDLRKELFPIESKLAAYSQSRFYSAAYFRFAEKIINYAEQKKSAESDDSDTINLTEKDSLLADLFNDKYDPILEKIKLQVQLDFIKLNLGSENSLVKTLCGNLEGKEAAESLLKRSKLSTKEKAEELLNEDPDDILNSDDPFIIFVAETKDDIIGLRERANEIKGTESVLVNMLGKVLFEVYGTEIPPDANFTLRLSDGVLQKFDYNGTVALEKTTFYGLYDRYYGSDKSYPWKLPTKWLSPPDDFDLSTTFNFISTNDIIGGNSGSAVINEDAEAVGLAFDGNIESIIGSCIYLPEDNRMVSVSTKAIVEALEKIYRAERIIKELMSGRIPD